MTNAALARRPDFPSFNAIPRNASEIASATALPNFASVANPGVQPAVVAAPPAAAAPASSVVQTISTYIPAEIMTLYVAFLGVLGHLTNPAASATTTTGSVTAATASPVPAAWVSLALFLVATPAVVWISFANKLRAAGKALPWRWSQWPVWEMTAASIAFVAWTFALPANPFSSYPWYSSGVAGFIVLGATMALGGLAPLFQRRLPT